MKLFSEKLLLDFMASTNFHDDMDAFINFVYISTSYIKGLRCDQRLNNLYVKMNYNPKIKNAINDAFSRCKEFNTLLQKQTKKIWLYDKIIRFLSVFNIHKTDLNIFQTYFIQKMAYRNLILKIYFKHYTWHFKMFKEKIVYKYSTFRELDDITDTTTLYDILPLNTGEDDVFYNSICHAIGWEFYCKQFTVKEFMEYFKLSIEDMKENGIYYIAEALDFDLSKNDESNFKKNIGIIDFSEVIQTRLSELYEKETGLSIENCKSQNLF